MAPGPLKGRFSHPNHHEHAWELSKIIKVIISFTYTHNTIDALEEPIVV
jgi:hypothetical protein